MRTIKFNRNFILFLFIILLLSSSFSLAQELSWEKVPLEVTEDLPIQEEPLENLITGNSHNESTYYMNTRPADFIQVVNTNGTEINETYIYLYDKLIAKYDTNGRKFFYHPDHLGSTSLVTNESGDVVEDLLYLPYGDLLSGNELSRFTYTGQEKDQETEFMNYGEGERSYYPRFARFLQCDEVKPNIYDPQLLNCYSYVRNNPYKYVDSSGNAPELFLTTTTASYVINNYVVIPTANFIKDYNNCPGCQGTANHLGIFEFGGLGFSAASKADDILKKLGNKQGSTGGLLDDLDGAVAGSGGKTAGGESSGVNKQDKSGSNVGNSAEANAENMIKTSAGDFSLTKHATDSINKGRVTPENVKSTIENTRPFSYDYNGGKYQGYYDSKSKTFVATQGNKIINTYRSRFGYINKLRSRR